MKLPNYLYANGKDDEAGIDLGAGCIISTRTPLVIGRIILYDNFYAMSKALQDRPPLAYAAIPGYSIALIFGGILGQDRLRITSPDDLKTIEAILNAMAAHYHKDKVLKHFNRYKRYLI
jgi:hypothetical protein